jgi:hypothetical protein
VVWTTPFSGRNDRRIGSFRNPSQKGFLVVGTNQVNRLVVGPRQISQVEPGVI